MLRQNISISAVLAVFLCVCLSSVMSAHMQWGQYAHDSQHSNYESVVPRNPLMVYPYSKQDTQLPAMASIASAEPVVDENGVYYYVTGDGSTVAAVKPHVNTSILWHTEVTTRVDNKTVPLTSNLALTADGTHLIAYWADANGNGRIVAINSADGSVIANSAVIPCAGSNVSRFVNNPLIHPNGNILVAGVCQNGDSHLYAVKLTANVFSTAFNHSYGGPADSGIVVTALGNIIISSPGVNVHSVTALRAADLSVYWNFTSDATTGNLLANSVTGSGALVLVQTQPWATLVILNPDADKPLLNRTYPGFTPLACGPTTWLFGWAQVKKDHSRVVAYNVTDDSQKSVWEWPVKKDEDSDDPDGFNTNSNAQITINGDNVAYVYVSQPGLQEVYGVNITNGAQLNGWPQQLYNNHKDKSVRSSFHAIHANTNVTVNETYSVVLVPQNNGSLAVLGCCSGNGECLVSSCHCTRENFYGDACQTYCLAETSCHGNGKCNGTGHCECKSTNFWELKTYSGDDCSQIVNLTIFGGIVVAILFFVIFVFSAFVIIRSRRATPSDYAPLSTIEGGDPYN